MSVLPTPVPQSEAEFNFLADFIPQLVWITDSTGFHTYFNQRWVDYTGYTLADSVGPDMWNNLLHPDDQARARQVWGHSLATGDNYEIEGLGKKAVVIQALFIPQKFSAFDDLLALQMYAVKDCPHLPPTLPPSPFPPHVPRRKEYKCWEATTSEVTVCRQCCVNPVKVNKARR